MYKIIDGQWLAKLVEGRIELTELGGSGGAFYGDNVGSEFIQAIEPCGEDNSNVKADLHFSSEDSTLLLNRTLANGLELKPLRLVLTPTTSGSLVSALESLVNDYRSVTKQLEKNENELKEAMQSNRDMVDEKIKFQDSVLQRVCAILDERNVWIDKFRTMKEES